MTPVPGNRPNGVRAFSIGEVDPTQTMRRRRGMPPLEMPALAEYLVQATIDGGRARPGPVDVPKLTMGGR